MFENLNRDEFAQAVALEIDFNTIFSPETGMGITEIEEQEERRAKVADVIGHFADRIGLKNMIQMMRLTENTSGKLDLDQSFVFVSFASEEMFDLLQNGIGNLRPDIFPTEERIEFSDTELRLMVAGGLSMLSKNINDLWTRYDEVKNRLMLTPADISLKGQWREGAFEGEESIRLAIEEGRLEQVPNEYGMLDFLSNVDEIQTHVDPRLVDTVRRLYIELAKEKNEDIRGFFDFSSGTRDFQKQKLLKKLGFPAAGLSYHNFGEAIDIKVKAENDQDLTKWRRAWKLKRVIRDQVIVDLLDETDFFDRPVFHLQIK